MECWQNVPFWAKFVGGIAVGLLVKKLLFDRKRKPKINKKDWEKDNVYLFQFERSPLIPSISPFCLKLETWLRFAGIKHESIFCMSKRSEKGLLPFVEVNGEQICDSALAIDRLTDYFEKSDLEKGLTKEQHGLARLIEQTIENTLFQSYVFSRFMEHIDRLLTKPIIGVQLPFFVIPIAKWRLQRVIMGRLMGSGIGRHTSDEINGIGQQDLKALSNLLGNQKFFLGDKPHRVDVTAFGHLAQMVYLPLGTPHERYISQECSNLKDFCDRMKQQFWPDWDEVLKKVD